ncbi:MAG: DUF1566 domain-containing protein [Saccharospirillaceae bacterium]|nr:DUF1566 domain-containing protein [Saccharospirillaceae bacterium]MCD8532733.1 DUF1566 domain-containing protein [Saccharospirillaceae bacterium]
MGLTGCDRDTPQLPPVVTAAEPKLGFSALPPIPRLHERARVEGQLALTGNTPDWSAFRVHWVFDEQPLGEDVAVAANGHFRLPRPLQDAPSGLWAEARAGAYRLRGQPDELGRLQLDALSTARAAISNGSRAEPASPQLEPLHNILHAVLHEGLGERVKTATGNSAAPLLMHFQDSWQLAQVLARSPVHRIAFQLRHQQALAHSFALLHQLPDFSHGDLSEQQRMVRLDRWGTPLRWQHRPYQEQAWGCVDYLQQGQRWLVSEESASKLTLNTLQQRLGELSQQHYCGQNQWRLPTVSELHSLLDGDNGDWAFPLSLPFTGSSIYWVQDQQGQPQIFDLQRNRIISDGTQAHWLPLVVRSDTLSRQNIFQKSVKSSELIPAPGWLELPVLQYVYSQISIRSAEGGMTCLQCHQEL